MAREQTERTAAILDSASTWHGVTRVVRSQRDRGTTTLRVDGRAIGRVGAGAVEAHFPGRLARSAVEHGLADAETVGGWTRLDAEERGVDDALELLRLAYLARVSRARRGRPDAFADVDVDAGLAELELSPGVVHLVREQARTE